MQVSIEKRILRQLNRLALPHHKSSAPSVTTFFRHVAELAWSELITLFDRTSKASEVLSSTLTALSLFLVRAISQELLDRIVNFLAPSVGNREDLIRKITIFTRILHRAF